MSRSPSLFDTVDTLEACSRQPQLKGGSYYRTLLYLLLQLSESEPQVFIPGKPIMTPTKPLMGSGSKKSPPKGSQMDRRRFCQVAGMAAWEEGRKT